MALTVLYVPSSLDSGLPCACNIRLEADLALNAREGVVHGAFFAPKLTNLDHIRRMSTHEESGTWL